MNNADDKKYDWVFWWGDNVSQEKLTLNGKTEEQAFDEARYFGWKPRNEVVPRWKFWSSYREFHARF